MNTSYAKPVSGFTRLLPGGDELPSYAEASTSTPKNTESSTAGATLRPYTSPPLVEPPPSASREPTSPAHKATTAHSQRYSSLFPPRDPSEPVGPPPNYESATSSLPDRIKPHPRTSEEEGGGSSRKPYLRHLQEKLTGPRPPPKPEGVPLELVVDRFGNRKRELKMRTFEQRLRHPVGVMAALHAPRR